MYCILVDICKGLKSIPFKLAIVDNHVDFTSKHDPPLLASNI
jgi:hypothetical protein